MKKTLTIALVGLSTVSLFGCSQSFDKTSYSKTYNSTVTDALNSADTFKTSLTGANVDVAASSLGNFKSDLISLSKLGETPGLPEDIQGNLNTTIEHLSDLNIRAGILDGFLVSDKQVILNGGSSELQPVMASVDQVVNQLKTDQSNAQQLFK